MINEAPVSVHDMERLSRKELAKRDPGGKKAKYHKAQFHKHSKLAGKAMDAGDHKTADIHHEKANAHAEHHFDITGKDLMYTEETFTDLAQAKDATGFQEKIAEVLQDKIASALTEAKKKIAKRGSGNKQGYYKKGEKRGVYFKEEDLDEGQVKHDDFDKWHAAATAKGHKVRKITTSNHNTYYQAHSKEGAIVGHFNTGVGKKGRGPAGGPHGGGLNEEVNEAT